MTDGTTRVEDEDIVTTWREDAKGAGSAPTAATPTAATATAVTVTAPTAPMATAPASRNPAIERCAGDPAAFVRDHWAKAPLLRRGAGPDGFDDLLSLDDVDRILATTSPRTPAFRMVKDGKPLPPSAQ